MSNLSIFIPITKIDSAKRIVYGTLTQAVPDKADEIIDYPTTKAAYQKWSDDASVRSGGKSKGNLRAMHANIAAGKFTDLVFDDANEKIEGAAYVSDDNEWKKCVDGTYTGFSHAGSYAKRWKDPDNAALTRYTPELTEVSLVDNPCVPTATFEFIKEDGSTELRKFNSHEVHMTEESKLTEAAENPVASEEASTPTPATLEKIAETPAEQSNERPQDKGGVVQGFMAKDGSFHVKKADALQRNMEVDAEAIAAPALEAVKNLTEAVTKAEGGEKPAPSPEGTVKEEPAAPPTAEMPPEAAKTSIADDLQKGMYAIGNFASLLQSIQCLQEDSEWEAAYEGDNSELPGKLKTWLADGATLLVQMVGEEAAELTAEKSTTTTDLAKKGAALSAATKGHIEKMMKSASDHLDEMGKCYKALGMAADETDEDKAEKNSTIVLENIALKKVLGNLTPQIDALTKRIESQQVEIKKLADQPLPPKGNLRVIDKTEDGGNVSDGDAVEKAQELLKGMTQDQVNMVLMKTALSQPRHKL